MTNQPQQKTDAPALDLGHYCRSVEEHLARVNEGHIIRIVGTAFEMVRGWAHEGIPLAIVHRGIEQKAERHRAGRSRRPLRLEFCETDVRALYDDWRRAVGLWNVDEEDPATPSDTDAPAGDARKRPSAVRELDRAIERLSAAASRLEQSDTFRERVSEILSQTVELREHVRRTRREARRALAEQAAELDRAIGAAARSVDETRLADARAEAASDLAAYRGRLAPAVWQRTLDAAVDRVLRARCGLPVIDPNWIAPDIVGSGRE